MDLNIRPDVQGISKYARWSEKEHIYATSSKLYKFING